MQHFVNYQIELSVSTKTFTNKNDIKWSSVRYKRQFVTIYDFMKLINEGHSFCYCFNDRGIEFGQSVKNENNFNHTDFIVLDVDDCPVDLYKFIDKLPIKPTLSYTTQNDKDTLHRFRLIYLFDNHFSNKEKIYVPFYLKIVSMIEIYTGVKMKDNCMASVAQQFAGNTRNDIIMILYNNIYSLSDFDKFKINDQYTYLLSSTVNCSLSNKIKGRYYNLKMNTISDEMINDFNNLKDNEFIKKYSKKYHYQMESKVDYDEDGIARIHTPYYKILHKFSKTDGHCLKWQNGENRGKRLYANTMMMFKIDPDITDENLLYNLKIELTYFFDNSDCRFTPKIVFDLIKTARKDNEAGKNISEPTPRLFKLDMNNEQIKKKIANAGGGRKGLNKVLGEIKKMLKDEEIGSIYDFSKGLRDNKRMMDEIGFQVSLGRLSQFKKRYESLYNVEPTITPETKENPSESKETALNSIPDNNERKVEVIKCKTIFEFNKKLSKLYRKYGEKNAYELFKPKTDNLTFTIAV